MRAAWCFSVCVVGSSVAVGCGGSSLGLRDGADASSPDGSISFDSGPDGAHAGTACVPGQSVACLGPSGCSSSQVCATDGSGFGSCDCAVAPDASTLLCTPGQSVACVGPGGCSTNQVCASDGSGPCNCASADASILCVPGESIACSGPGGCISSQACKADGSGYGECVCSGDAGATLLCIPGQSIACAGEYGCASFQVCNASGSAYGPCDCPVFDDAGALPDGSVVSSAAFGPATPIEEHVLVPPALLASDGNDLFWTDENGGVWRDPVTGGAVTQIATGANANSFLYVDSTNVYFLGPGGISAVPKVSGTNGTVTVLIATTDAQAGTVSKGQVYWIEQAQMGSPATIKSAPLVAGGTATTFATMTGLFGPFSSMAVSGSAVYLEYGLYVIQPGASTPTQVPASCGMLVPGTAGVYCTDLYSVVIVAPNGTMTTFSSEANQANGMAADESDLYWSNDVASGSVIAASLAAGRA